MCTEYIEVNIYPVSAQGVDKRMINVRYYYQLFHKLNLQAKWAVNVTKSKTTKTVPNWFLPD